MELILVLDTNDIWIAAATHERRGRLVSSDDHFRLLLFIGLEEELVFRRWFVETEEPQPRVT